MNDCRLAGADELSRKISGNNNTTTTNTTTTTTITTTNNNYNNEFICGVIEGFYGKPWSFEQRKDLFKRLKDLKLNSFLYAPKDDLKHRANWRQLYSDREANELRVLIEEAKSNGIDFYYSLAPGLDMCYSDSDELNRLLRKYDQVVGLGCESFALLFDDIEPKLNDKDKEIFKNYASAQVSTTNTVFDHLNKPKFLFCPTEYCESRAVPNVTNSIYLNTLGIGLQAGIDVLWSGSRVISRLITEESMETLANVIKRPPLIWENLHANDYDKKRVFLGPYSGRSTKIIPKIRGVLTNPNCEYEANYIAIHTLAQWSRCTNDINLHNRCNPDQRVPESEINTGAAILPMERSNLNNFVYNPDRALIYAIRDWLPHLLENKPLPSGIDLIARREDEQQQMIKDDQEQASVQRQSTRLDSNRDTDSLVDDVVVIDMIPAEESQSPEAGVAGDASPNKSEMDTSGSTTQGVAPSQSHEQSIASNLIEETNSCDSCDMQDAALNNTSTPTTTTITTAVNQESSLSLDKVKSQTGNCVDCFMCSATSNTIPENAKSQPYQSEASTNITATVAAGQQLLSFDNLTLLVDLFYLPFEHGSQGFALLKDIKWLRDNSDILIMEKQRGGSTTGGPNENNNRVGDEEEAQMNDDEEDNGEAVALGGGGGDHQETGDMNSKLTVEVWIGRAEKLNNLCTCITQLVDALIYHCPNQLLIIELYPYLVDLRDVISIIIDYIKFLRYRTSERDQFYFSYNKPKESPIATDEQEPWVHRGGLVGDVQRLLS